MTRLKFLPVMIFKVSNNKWKKKIINTLYMLIVASATYRTTDRDEGH